MDMEVGTGECVGEQTRRGEDSLRRGDLQNRQTTLHQSAVMSWDWEAVYHEAQKPDATEILPEEQEISMYLFTRTGRKIETPRRSLFTWHGSLRAMMRNRQLCRILHRPSRSLHLPHSLSFYRVRQNEQGSLHPLL